MCVSYFVSFLDSKAYRVKIVTSVPLDRDILWYRYLNKKFLRCMFWCVFLENLYVLLLLIFVLIPLNVYFNLIFTPIFPKLRISVVLFKLSMSLYIF